jgi:hypothetical protein
MELSTLKITPQEFTSFHKRRIQLISTGVFLLDHAYQKEIPLLVMFDYR